MEAAIDNDEFIEYATFAGNMYGTSKAAVRCVMEKGKVKQTIKVTIILIYCSKETKGFLLT